LDRNKLTRSLESVVVSCDWCHEWRSCLVSDGWWIIV